MSDDNYMRLALKEAEIALREGNWPIGCVIELDGRAIAQAHNQVYTLNNKLAHAEIQALAEVQQILLANKQKAVLYTTYEPCPMCFGASMLSRIRKVVCGVDLDNSGAMYLRENAPVLFKQEFKIELVRGVLARECAEVFMKGEPTKDLMKKGLLSLKALEAIL